MSSAIPFPSKRENAARATPALDLPGPRVWRVDDLANFLRVSKSWIYQRTTASAEDPIPRIPGVGRLSFDTHDPRFVEWMRRQLGHIDGMEANG